MPVAYEDDADGEEGQTAWAGCSACGRTILLIGSEEARAWAQAHADRHNEDRPVQRWITAVPLRPQLDGSPFRPWRRRLGRHLRPKGEAA